MAQSLNTKVDFTAKSTSFLGFAKYGNIMVGDKAFEFYNEKNVSDNIQIPWEEIDGIMASVLFRGKWIPRFAVVTKNNGNFVFSSKECKALLRAINKYIPSDKLVRSLSFFQVIKKGVKNIFTKLSFSRNS